MKKMSRLKRIKNSLTLPKILYFVFAMTVIMSVMTQTVLAEDVWDKANEILTDVYNHILLLSTIAGVVTAAIALLLMSFSKSGKTVDESRAWLKRIAITWAILNGLGFIMAYVAPFFANGKWTG
ncbi:MAG: fimbrial protein [Clostridia bacterium]|nr:fimbrial protein [Clostridia bacterium]